MWIYSIYGMFSVAVTGNTVWVRARNKKHLEALQHRFQFSGAILVTPPPNDYGWRVRLSRAVWERILIAMSREQTWDNFKGQVKKAKLTDAKYEKLLHDIWHLAFQYQIQKHPAILEHADSIEEVGRRMLNDGPDEELLRRMRRVDGY